MFLRQKRAEYFEKAMLIPSFCAVSIERRLYVSVMVIVNFEDVRQMPLLRLSLITGAQSSKDTISEDSQEW